MAVTLHEIGRCLFKMNELTDAKNHLERALSIEQQLSSDVATDRGVAIILLVLVDV